RLRLSARDSSVPRQRIARAEPPRSSTARCAPGGNDSGRRSAAGGVTVIDLDAYFRRVGYDGPPAPTLETLRALPALHAAAITFENLNQLMGRPVSVDLAVVQEKILPGGRGGWCFEQNLLFGEALRAIGFPVIDLAARVIWGEAEDAITRRSHRVLL